MTSLIRARWRVEIHEPSSPPPTIASSRENGGEQRISSEFPNGSGHRSSNRFQIINLDLFRARIARPLFADYRTPPRISAARTNSAKLDVLATRPIRLVWGQQLLFDLAMTAGFFSTGFLFPRGERRGEIDENCNGSEASTRGGWSVGWWKWEAMLLERDKQGEGGELHFADSRFFIPPSLFIIINTRCG